MLNLQKIVDLHNKYFDAYVDSVPKATKLESDEISKAEKDLEYFINFTIVDVPAMKIL